MCLWRQLQNTYFNEKWKMCHICVLILLPIKFYNSQYLSSKNIKHPFIFSNVKCTIKHISCFVANVCCCQGKAKSTTNLDATNKVFLDVNVKIEKRESFFISFVKRNNIHWREKCNGSVTFSYLLLWISHKIIIEYNIWQIYYSCIWGTSNRGRILLFE